MTFMTDTLLHTRCYDDDFPTGKDDYSQLDAGRGNQTSPLDERTIERNVADYIRCPEDSARTGSDTMGALRHFIKANFHTHHLTETPYLVYRTSRWTLAVDKATEGSYLLRSSR